MPGSEVVRKKRRETFASVCKHRAVRRRRFVELAPARTAVAACSPSASNASMLAAAFGGAAERVSGLAAASGSEKPVEEVRRALPAGVPSVVPFGP